MTRRRHLGPGTALRGALDQLTAPPAPTARQQEWLLNSALQDVVEESRTLVEACAQRVAAWEEQVLSADCDELREIAAEARREGRSPVDAVDTAVRTALGDLVRWEAELAGLAAALVERSAQVGLVGLHPDAVDAGRGLDERLEWARVQLLRAVAEYHHGSAGHQRRMPRPW
ncbi:hypothetical protein ABT093_20140 [Kitasatospora sp. NPDC002551]|uniref:hypothetical protein n=1 Tax=Kitasatospora sp. NPDC002551 TaxID=3154539 RepID=UPI0033231B13